MDLVSRLIDQLIFDAVESAARRSEPVPVGELADDILREARCSRDRKEAIINRIALLCVARGLIIEFRNTSHRVSASRQLISSADEALNTS